MRARRSYEPLHFRRPDDRHVTGRRSEDSGLASRSRGVVMVLRQIPHHDLAPVRAGHGTTVTTFGGKAAASRPHDCIAGREALCRSKAAWAAGTANKPKQSIDVNSPLIRQF